MQEKSRGKMLMEAIKLRCDTIYAQSSLNLCGESKGQKGIFNKENYEKSEKRRRRRTKGSQ